MLCDTITINSYYRELICPFAITAKTDEIVSFAYAYDTILFYIITG